MRCRIRRRGRAAGRVHWAPPIARAAVKLHVLHGDVYSAADGDFHGRRIGCGHGRHFGIENGQRSSAEYGGLSSDPATHQAQLATPVSLGSSGGNNNDYDISGNQIVDCCGGTLGSLIQTSSGTQYLLSNNHVLARSDQASVGETIVQPGLIDDNCTPYGQTAPRSRRWAR